MPLYERRTSACISASSSLIGYWEHEYGECVTSSARVRSNSDESGCDRRSCPPPKGGACTVSVPLEAPSLAKRQPFANHYRPWSGRRTSGAPSASPRQRTLRPAGRHGDRRLPSSNGAGIAARVPAALAARRVRCRTTESYTGDLGAAVRAGAVSPVKRKKSTWAWPIPSPERTWGRRGSNVCRAPRDEEFRAWRNLSGANSTALGRHCIFTPLMRRILPVRVK
jgi:hypothetical protein